MFYIKVKSCVTDDFVIFFSLFVEISIFFKDIVKAMLRANIFKCMELQRDQNSKPLTVSESHKQRKNH